MISSSALGDYEIHWQNRIDNLTIFVVSLRHARMLVLGDIEKTPRQRCGTRICITL